MALTIEIIQMENGKGLSLPKAETLESAGHDLMAAIEESLVLKPGGRLLIPCGFKMALQAGYEAQIRPRSGLGYKHGVTVLNAPGTIDSDYRGEIKVLLINLGQEEFIVERGMRIAQLIIARYERIEWQPVTVFNSLESARGVKGFGSTGV